MQHVRYHPAANGSVERQHRTLKQSLLFYTKRSSRWDEILDAFIFSVRNTVRNEEGFSPAFLAFGRELRVPLENLQNDIVWRDLSTFVSEKIFELARANKIVDVRRRARWERNKAYHDSLHAEAKFEVGDQVFLRKPQKPKGISKKLWIQNEGPYTVTKVLGQTFELDVKGAPQKWHAEHLFKPNFPSPELQEICDERKDELEDNEMLKRMEEVEGNKEKKKEKKNEYTPKRATPLKPFHIKEEVKFSEVKIGDFCLIQRDETRFLVQTTQIEEDKFWGQILRPLGDPKDPSCRFTRVWYDRKTIEERWGDDPEPNELAWETDFWPEDIYLKFKRTGHQNTITEDVRKEWTTKYGKKIMCS